MNDLQKVMRLKGDKYSKRIRNFSLKNRHISNVISVPWCRINGQSDTERQFYFAYDDYLNGVGFSAYSIQSIRQGNYQGGCYVGSEDFMKAVQEHTNVTQWFIKNYKQFGMCCFGDNWHHDFVKINKNSRRCKHCNKIEYRSIKNGIIKHRDEIWSAA